MNSPANRFYGKTFLSLRMGDEMDNHTVIRLDLAKAVFQVGVMNNGNLTSNRQVKRASPHSLMANQPPSTVAMEASYSSHYWARAFKALAIR
jgi:transposase